MQEIVFNKIIIQYHIGGDREDSLSKGIASKVPVASAASDVPEEVALLLRDTSICTITRFTISKWLDVDPRKKIRIRIQQNDTDPNPPHCFSDLYRRFLTFLEPFLTSPDHSKPCLTQPGPTWLCLTYLTMFNLLDLAWLVLILSDLVWICLTLFELLLPNLNLLKFAWLCMSLSHCAVSWKSDYKQISQ